MAIVALLAWLGLAYCTAPADAHEYRRTAVEAAQASLAAVRTVALAGAANEDGKLLDPYLSALIDDEAGSVAGAQQRLAALPPPDPATRALRDELTPLLVEAARQIGDLDGATSAGDREAVDAHVDGLRRVGDRLDDLVGRYR